MSVIIISILFSIGIWIILFTYSADFLNFVVIGDENKLLENVNIIVHEISLDSANYVKSLEIQSYSNWTNKIVDRTLFVISVVAFLLVFSNNTYNQIENKILNLFIVTNGILALIYNWIFLIPARELSANVGIHIDDLLVIVICSGNIVGLKRIYRMLTGKSFEMKLIYVIVIMMAAYIELLAFSYLALVLGLPKHLNPIA